MNLPLGMDRKSRWLLFSTEELRLLSDALGYLADFDTNASKFSQEIERAYRDSLARTDERMAAPKIHTCETCKGCGRIAEHVEMPWDEWREKDPQLSAAGARSGYIKPQPCPDCGGLGRTPF